MVFDIVSGKGASARNRFDVTKVGAADLAITAGKTKFEKDIVPEYSGDYEIMPTDKEIILPTSERRLSENIVVKPIPNNYGKVIYNGSYIRIE